MIRRQPVSTRTVTLFPYTPLYRSAGLISTNAAATGVPPDTQYEAASSDANGSIEVNGDLIQLGDVSSHAEASDAGRYANADIRLSAGYYATLVDFAATDGGDTSAASSIGSIDAARSDERRVGKECVSTCRARWSPYH